MKAWKYNICLILLSIVVAGIFYLIFLNFNQSKKTQVILDTITKGGATFATP